MNSKAYEEINKGSITEQKAKEVFDKLEEPFSKQEKPEIEKTFDELCGLGYYRSQNMMKDLDKKVHPDFEKMQGYKDGECGEVVIQGQRFKFICSKIKQPVILTEEEFNKIITLAHSLKHPHVKYQSNELMTKEVADESIKKGTELFEILKKHITKNTKL